MCPAEHRGLAGFSGVGTASHMSWRMNDSVEMQAEHVFQKTSCDGEKPSQHCQDVGKNV